MKAPITFAIAGFGDRGSTYASMQKLFPDRMKVVAVADINPEKVQKAKELYGIKDELCFTSAEEMLAQDKLADVMVVSTMDRQHVNHAIPALEKGYNILMEKPISPDLQECKRIIEVAKHCPGKIIVCHVLRYTTFYNTLKSILDSKKIGDVVSVCANENVGYWHQAHSFVRGNWRNSDQTSPMILQKCCHDMDIYTWLLGKKCKAISSVGDTHLFKKECAPEGATPYCLGGCKAKENCKFDAEKIYITNPATGIRNGNTWMAGVACGVNPTEERTYEALKNGQYGRCVYMCDNNVVDHQQTNLLFEDGTTMSFTMCAFTEKCYRYFKAMGTNGEIEADMLSNKIHVRVFGEPEEIIDVKLLANDLKGHGGGDSGIVNDFLDMLINETEATERTTTLEHSLESHFMALAAEESRLRGGELINMDAFNPETDSKIFKNYGPNNPQDKLVNKTELLKLCGLEGDANTPVIGIVTRFVDQKGLDLVEAVLPDILADDVRLIVLGTGDYRYEQMFIEAKRRWPDKVSASIMFSGDLANRIYAGADMFLMPSKFEPCGLAQMIALRYGTIPIVRETGGLKDTVHAFVDYAGTGNGFTFASYNAHDMLHVIREACGVFRFNKPAWSKLIMQGMQSDFSWGSSADKYIEVYKTAMGQ